MKIESVTISLHTGLSHIFDRQMEWLRPLSDRINVNYNNRFERHPGSYDTYSEMVNDAVSTSPDEFVVLINDRTFCNVEQTMKIVDLLQSGFAASTMYSVGYIGYSKELFRKIGMWDERFYGGGFEDDDFVIRLRHADFAYYESQEGRYDQSFKSHLRPAGGDACMRSEPEFKKKWDVLDDRIVKKLPEVLGKKYYLGPERNDISETWKKWEDSVLGINFPVGNSRTKWFMRQPVDNTRKVYTKSIVIP